MDPDKENIKSISEELIKCIENFNSENSDSGKVVHNFTKNIINHIKSVTQQYMKDYAKKKTDKKPEPTKKEVAETEYHSNRPTRERKHTPGFEEEYSKADRKRSLEQPPSREKETRRNYVSNSNAREKSERSHKPLSPEEHILNTYRKTKVEYVDYDTLQRDKTNCRCKHFGEKKVRDRELGMFQCNSCSRWNHLECMNYFDEDKYSIEEIENLYDVIKVTFNHFYCVDCCIHKKHEFFKQKGNYCAKMHREKPDKSINSKQRDKDSTKKEVKSVKPTKSHEKTSKEEYDKEHDRKDKDKDKEENLKRKRDKVDKKDEISNVRNDSRDLRVQRRSQVKEHPETVVQKKKSPINRVGHSAKESKNSKEKNKESNGTVGEETNGTKGENTNAVPTSSQGECVNEQDSKENNNSETDSKKGSSNTHQHEQPEDKKSDHRKSEDKKSPNKSLEGKDSPPPSKDSNKEEGHNLRSRKVSHSNDQ